MSCDHSHNKTVQCDTCYGNIFTDQSTADEVSLDDLR